MGGLRILLTVALLMVGPALALADLDKNTDPPSDIQPTSATLSDVLALNTKAEGKRLDSFRSRIEERTSRIGGQDNIEKSLWLGKDFKITTTWGPFEEQTGRINGVRWRQSINGMVVIESGLHQESDRFDQTVAAARSGMARDSVRLLGEVNAPYAAYVVQIQPAGDAPVWWFVDRTTGLVKQSESVADGIRFTTTYSDFATFSGANVAQSVVTADGRAEDEQSNRLTSLHLDAPVTMAQLSIPQNRRPLVEFPAGVTSVQLPVSMPLSYNTKILMDSDYQVQRSSLKRHIVVRVNIKGRGLDFLIDSGASGIFIDKEVADQLGLTEYSMNGSIFGGATRQAVVMIPELQIGALKMKNVAGYAQPFSMRLADTEKVVGIIGYDLIASVGLKVDWDKREVTAFAPGTIPMPQTSITLPVMLDDLVPYVSVTIGNSESDHFVLDTGSDEVQVFPPFAAAHKADVLDQGLGREEEIYIPETYFVGAGGLSKAHRAQVKNFIFGIQFSQFLVFVVSSDIKYGWQDIDGLIGYQFLHYFNLYFDYPNSRIVLEPNEQYQTARKIPTR